MSLGGSLDAWHMNQWKQKTCVDETEAPGSLFQWKQSVVSVIEALGCGHSDILRTPIHSGLALRKRKSFYYWVRAGWGDFHSLLPNRICKQPKLSGGRSKLLATYKCLILLEGHLVKLSEGHIIVFEPCADSPK